MFFRVRNDGGQYQLSEHLLLADVQFLQCTMTGTVFEANLVEGIIALRACHLQTVALRPQRREVVLIFVRRVQQLYRALAVDGFFFTGTVAVDFKGDVAVVLQV